MGLAEDPALRDEMQHWVDRSSLTDDPLNHGDESAGNAVPGLTLPIFAAMIDRIPYWKILEGALFHFDKRRPLMFFMLKLRGLEALSKLSPLIKMVSRSRRQMHAHLDALEEQLAKRARPWILGEAFSLADVSWLVIFERLVQVDALGVFLGHDQRPLCATYWASLKARPSYRSAILEHSPPTIDHGTRRLKNAKAANPTLRLALEGTLP